MVGYTDDKERLSSILPAEEGKDSHVAMEEKPGELGYSGMGSQVR